MTYNRFPKPKKEFNKIFATVNTNLSYKTSEKLREISFQKRIPISTLISRAIENELGCENPFDRDLTIPIKEYVDKYTPTSQLLFDFIKTNPGLCLEHFLILKGDIGIETDKEVKLAYHHLLQVELIEEYKVVHSKFIHAPSHRVVRILIDKQLPKKRKPYKELTKGPLNEVE